MLIHSATGQWARDFWRDTVIDPIEFKSGRGKREALDAAYLSHNDGVPAHHNPPAVPSCPGGQPLHLPDKGRGRKAAAAAAAAVAAAAAGAYKAPPGGKGDRMTGQPTKPGKDLNARRPDGRRLYGPDGKSFCLNYQLGKCTGQSCPLQHAHGCELCGASGAQSHPTVECNTADPAARAAIAANLAAAAKKKAANAGGRKGRKVTL